MYFEIDDVKRRHTMYYDIYNFTGWVDTPDSSYLWNWTRGAMAGTIGCSVQSIYSLYHSNYLKMVTKYKPPQNISQVFTFLRAIPKMPNFSSEMRRGLAFAVAMGSIDIGTRHMLLRSFTEGLPQDPTTANTEYWRKPIPITFAALLTCWMRAPLEISQKAFYSDQKFPKHLRYGYTSIRNAFFQMLTKRPYALYKSSYPTFFGVFFQTLSSYYLFDYIEDNYHFFYNSLGMNRSTIKFVNCFISTNIGLMASYPFMVKLRELVELQPRSLSKDIFHNNYRRAFYYLGQSMPGTNLFQGMGRYYHNNFIWLFTSLWVAENLGLFKRWRHKYWQYPHNLSLDSFNV